MGWVGWPWVQIHALQCQGSWICISVCETQDLLALRSVCSMKSFPIHSRVDDNFWGKFQVCDDSYRILTAFLHLRQNAAGIVEELVSSVSVGLLNNGQNLSASTEDFHTLCFFYSYPVNIVLKGFLQSFSGTTVRLCLGGLGLRKL